MVRVNPSVEREFNPRIAAPRFADEAPRRSALARRTTALVEERRRLEYGDGPREFVDLYRPSAPNGWLAVYFHGGYWRAGHPDDYAFVAGPLLAAGATVAIPGYDLCPSVPLAVIVEQARVARDRLLCGTGMPGVKPGQVLLSGSSAGAHLAAMLMLDGPAAWSAPPVAALITGVYDLEPVRHTSVNEDLHLHSDDVERLSPLRRSGRLHCSRLLVAVGKDEPGAWKAMSRGIAQRAIDEGTDCSYLEIAGCDHFSVTTELGRQGRLACAVAALMGESL